MNQPNKDLSGLGAHIRQAREAAGLSVRQVAELVGTAHSQLVKIENGYRESPPAELLQRIANALEIDATDLLGFIGVTLPKGLPSVEPYLRAKYKLKGEALQEATEQLQRIINKYDGTPPDK
jgi:transcriptional regulator with XRE-family HTH domain